MLADFENRSAVANQAFNLSNAYYETAEQVGAAISCSYNLKLEFDMPVGGVDINDEAMMNSVHGLANFSQWVGSDKIRAITGWHEKRPSFVQGFEEYRLAYEAHAGTVIYS